MAKLQMSLKARAVRFLSLREHSRVELARKLQRYGNEDEIAQVLDVLEKAQLLSVDRFAETLVRKRASRFGNARILHELQGHDVPGEVLSDLKTQMRASEADRALSILERRTGGLQPDAELKAKLVRYLQQRGFSHDAIRQAFSRLGESATEFLDADPCA